MTSCYNLHLWPLRSPCISMLWVIVLHPYTEFEVRRPSIPKMWLIFGHGVKPPDDLDRQCPFDSKWGHGSPVSWASLLPIFSFLRPPFRSRLRVRHGTDRQTDRQTDRYTDKGHHCIIPHPIGAGHNIDYNITIIMKIDCNCIYIAMQPIFRNHYVLQGCNRCWLRHWFCPCYDNVIEESWLVTQLSYSSQGFTNCRPTLYTKICG